MKGKRRLKPWVKPLSLSVLMILIIVISGIALNKMDNDSREYNYKKCGGKQNTIEYRDNHGDLSFECK